MTFETIRGVFRRNTKRTPWPSIYPPVDPDKPDGERRLQLPKPTDDMSLLRFIPAVMWHNLPAKIVSGYIMVGPMLFFWAYLAQGLFMQAVVALLGLSGLMMIVAYMVLKPLIVRTVYLVYTDENEQGVLDAQEWWIEDELQLPDHWRTPTGRNRAAWIDLDADMVYFDFWTQPLPDESEEFPRPRRFAEPPTVGRAMKSLLRSPMSAREALGIGVLAIIIGVGMLAVMSGVGGIQEALAAP